MNSVINVGLIGYGGGGKYFHAPIIDSVPELKLFKVYTTNPENELHLKEKYRDVQVVSELNDIVEDPNIQLVIVATPNTLHYEVAKKALENGKNVVVEKPFTPTTDEADKLISIAKANNKLLTVHHNRRWDSDFRTVQKVVNTNLLGEVVSYEANFDRFNPGFKQHWKEKEGVGSGILFDLGSHLIDQALCLFGLPQEVFSNLEIQKQGGVVPDYFKLIMKFPKVNVTLKAGSLVREVGPRYAVHGTKGSFTKYGLDVQEVALKNDLLPRNLVDWGKEPNEIWGTLNTELNGVHIIGKIESEIGDYREFYRNVYNAILGKDTVKVKPEEARNTIKIIELAEQSNSEKRWVKF